jgi:2-hydroxymuconate-semialdehyde hydrolase
MSIYDLPTKRITTGNGIDTAYYETGSGAPVIFLHGSGIGVSSRVNWWLNMPVVGEHYRALALDLIGFGDTVDPPDSTYGVKAWIDHVLAFMDALGLEKASLVGNSLGGWLCLEFGTQHPERVDKLIPMGPGGRFRDDLRNESEEPHRKRIQAYSPSREKMSKLVLDYVHAPDRIPQELVDARLEQSLKPGSAERYAAMAESRSRDHAEYPLDEAILSKLDRPTMIVHGLNDVVIPASSAWRLAHALPDCRLVAFGQCGHWAQIEKAAEFNAVCLSFLATA